MATFFTVLVLIFTYVITATTLSIFDVTEKLLGLKEADFHGRLPKLTVLARMDTQFRIKYNELERTDPEAFKFMKMLYGHAVRAADHPWEAQAALHKVVHFYRNKMSMNQLRNLHRLFPAVEKIFSQYGR
ncbi:hypothetical protein GCK32_014030 [Trichostrongylus colubriformis]|uniref:Uncharacterized protein n=1 Tax=Trichostrongylus colubriformis TaxID=6319 RepID=A0AAN8FGL6_TRICO